MHGDDGHRAIIIIVIIIILGLLVWDVGMGGVDVIPGSELRTNCISIAKQQQLALTLKKPSMQ